MPTPSEGANHLYYTTFQTADDALEHIASRTDAY